LLIQTASQEYAKAMALCHELSSSNISATGDDDETDDDAKRLERQDLFLTRADTRIRPLFRYCQYELKQAGQETMEEPRHLTSSSSNTNSEKDDETSILFRGHELIFLESKELRVLMLKLQSLQNNSTEGAVEESKHNDDETSFLNVLSVLDDALEVVQGLLGGALEHANAGPAVQAKRAHLFLWKGYLQSEKTMRVMEHTQALLRDITGHAERVHVYESLLQHAKSLLELPRPNDDPEEEDEFALQVQANRLRLRALKCYHMAWYYYQQPRKYAAALTLMQQATKLAKRAQEEIAACDEDMPHADEYTAELEGLPLGSATAAIQAAMYLQGGGGKHATKEQPSLASSTTRPLLLRLDEPDAGMVMAQVLPMPIPCKPVFYDLAYDYAVDATEAVHKIETYVGEHTVQPEPVEEEVDANKKGGGLLGWFTGGK
jgi:hypothetical protein